MLIDWCSEKKTGLIKEKLNSQHFDFKVFGRLKAVLKLHDAYPTHATEITENVFPVVKVSST